MEKKITYKEAWSAPFRVSAPYIFDGKSKMLLMAMSDDADKLMEHVVNKLNDTYDERFEVKTYLDDYDESEEPIEDCVLVINGEEFLIRGWGYLTGVGGLHLPEEDAAKVQDDMVLWIKSKLEE